MNARTPEERSALLPVPAVGARKIDRRRTDRSTVDEQLSFMSVPSPCAAAGRERAASIQRDRAVGRSARAPSVASLAVPARAKATVNRDPPPSASA